METDTMDMELTTGMQLDRFLSMGMNATVMVHGVPVLDLFDLMHKGTVKSLRREPRPGTYPGDDVGEYLVAKATIDGVDVTLFSADLPSDDEGSAA